MEVIKMEWSQNEMNELYTKVMKMSATNEEFRKEVLADPIAAMEKLSGKKIPEDIAIKVIEQDPAYESTIVLPKFVGDAMELEDLDEVAGGIIMPFIGKKAFIVVY